MKKILYTGILLLFLSSCVPGKKIVFDSLLPADFTFPVGTEKVLVFNSSYTPAYDTMDFNVLRKLDQEEQYIIDTLIINSIFDGFFYVADQSPVPSLMNSVYAEERSEDTVNFLAPISESSIDYLLEEFEADIVVSLEYYGMNYDYSAQLGEFDNTEAYLFLDRKLLWRIYSREGMVKENNRRDTLFWTAFGVNEEDALGNLPDLVDVVRESFWYAGESFAGKLSPVWDTNRRSYFYFNDHGADRSLDPVYLKEIASSGTGQKAYKAYFNLSVYYERSGEVRKALNYMNKALEIRPGASLARYYRKKLQEKAKYMDKLEEQVKPGSDE